MGLARKRRELISSCFSRVIRRFGACPTFHGGLCQPATPRRNGTGTVRQVLSVLSDVHGASPIFRSTFKYRNFTDSGLGRHIPEAALLTYR